MVRTLIKTLIHNFQFPNSKILKMKNIFFATCIVVFCSMFSLNAEDVDIIMKKGERYSFSENQFDPDSSTHLKIIRKDNVSEVQEFLFPFRVFAEETRTDGNVMKI